MEKSCLERIILEYNNLNKAEKKAAQYILDNSEEVIHYSIKELADKTGVSNTTIFRLCNSLGFSGFRELKINLASSLNTSMKTLHEEVVEEDDTYMVMQKILNSNKLSMEKTLEINSREVIDKIVDKMSRADRIIFAGMGGSGPIAEDAYHKFIRTGIKCEFSSDSHWHSMYISLADERDIFFAVSNSGRNKELLNSIKQAKAKGLYVIALTSNIESPIALNSDYVLISYGVESAFRSEAMESRTSALMLIDIIYIKMSMDKESEVLTNLMDIRSGIADKRTKKKK